MSQGTMMGSGIYSETETVSINCVGCGKDFDVDLETDDSGNIEATNIPCPKCKNRENRYSYERDDENDFDETAWEMLNDK